MTDFTVVGFYTDTWQRFSSWICAKGADDAEDVCARTNPGIAICAVILGRHSCLDPAESVRFEQDGLSVNKIV